MRAVFIERFGGPEVLRFGDQPTPTPRADQVLVAVHAASVNPRDWLLREGRYVFRHLMPGFPLILGSDVSGVVVARGRRAARFAVGDAVFGLQPPFGRMGGYAEYVAIPERALAAKPAALTHEEAAAVPCAGLTAYDALVGLGGVGPGARVLVIGASGGVGSYAVQVAAALGATVTAVTSTANVAFARSLGAHAVVDYRTERAADLVRDQDLVFDTIGRERPASWRAMLAPGGRHVTTIPGAATFARAGTTAVARLLTAGRAARSHVVLVRARGEHLERLAAWMQEGRVRSVIDGVYPLHEARAAHERSRTWRTRGKLVLQVAGPALPAGGVPRHGAG